MRAWFAVGVLFAMLAGPAFAQMDMTTQNKDPLQAQYERERKAREEAAAAYDEMMKRTKTPAPTVKNDPWAGVRSTNDTKK